MTAAQPATCRWHYTRVVLVVLITVCSRYATAEWSVSVDNSLHYTDNVALFSVSRRLSLKDDPTQPMVDRPGQGGDFIYQPSTTVEWLKKNEWGQLGCD